MSLSVEAYTQTDCDFVPKWQTSLLFVFQLNAKILFVFTSKKTMRLDGLEYVAPMFLVGTNFTSGYRSSLDSV